MFEAHAKLAAHGLLPTSSDDNAIGAETGLLREVSLCRPAFLGFIDGRRTSWWLVMAVVATCPAAPAMAGCIQDHNNTPNAPQTYDHSNQTFTPAQPFAITTYASNGCTAPAQTRDFANGMAGGDGQIGTQITSTNNAITIIGGSSVIPTPQTIGAGIVTEGGNAGDGGQAGPSTSGSGTVGGAGGAGGSGGPLSVVFNGTVDPSTTYTLPNIGLLVSSLSGAGGNAGASTSISSVRNTGGAGGTGGSGAAVSLTASGSYHAGMDGILVYSGGGIGGAGGYAYSGEILEELYGGVGGAGGAGGQVTLKFTSGTIEAQDVGLSAASSGGDGNQGGGTAVQAGTTGGNGGAGGAGGTISVALGGGSINVAEGPSGSNGRTAAIVAQSNGGNGGAGGKPGTSGGAGGGSGGNGGVGGSVTVDINGAVALTGLNHIGTPDSVGVLVQSNGGMGGAAGDESSIVGEGGGGGFAGAGGPATLTVGGPTGSPAGTITTDGNFAHAALVQSVGGGGGSGGQASFGGSRGGNGGIGGDGGPVMASVLNGSTITLGNNSIGVVAQSVGGGGGAGGDAHGIEVVSAYVIGGNGGQGGDGKDVTVNLGRNAVIGSSGMPTSSSPPDPGSLPMPMGGGGVLAQSIGGAGGVAGSASSTGVGLIAVVLGGTGGPGGIGGTVNVTSAGLVTSFGDHAPGIEAQSIGGGGGKGGSVTNFSSNPAPTAAVSVGGRGGSGGDGGEATITNSGQVSTYGTDAPGVALQSIGGGGGSGGSAAADAVSLSPSKYIPAVSVSISLGGDGGAGGKGNTVTLNNSGLITTGGDGSLGVVAQSIGGGGGMGGDSSAASYSNGRQSTVNISVSVSIGGQGGNGGNGANVTITTAAPRATAGPNAYGGVARGGGGGGGVGGGGDATSTAADAKASLGTSIAVGGEGGGGGTGGTVTLTNRGAITTRGDASHGIFAQSVGGGGGAAGGGTANASGTKLAIAVGVGGTGGSGGDGGPAGATNSGLILTRGTAAHGIWVQSIGGGGGAGGKSGATAGGTTPFSSAQGLFDTVGKGLGLNQGVIDKGDGIFQIGELGEDYEASLKELEGIFDQPQSGEPEEESSTSFQVSVSVGGRGGAGGKGMAATATNTGTIMTLGAESDGIYAQSVGGGGGNGGAATSTSECSDDSCVQTAIAVGGTGGGGGNGGTVTVTNAPFALLQTQGISAFGIMAQSVGGGGGEGSVAGTVDGSLKSFAVGLGGGGGGGGDGGTVGVTNRGTIATTAKHGIGILAQSIGGGGGLARSITTNETFDPSKIDMNPQGRIGDIQGLALALGGQNGISGRGGPVTVTDSGPISTAGLDAHGILAQSIGGGGGAVIGGQVTSIKTAGGSSGGGNGGTVDLELQPGASISTKGDGAYGILAQSIGGGGGIAGDPSSYGGNLRLGTQGEFVAGTGNGNTVTVSANGASVQTSGNNAPAILAQSLGGGGGLIDYGPNGSSRTLALGDAAGPGNGGTISIKLANSKVATSGSGSPGILAQSDGGTAPGQIVISLDKTSSIQATTGPAISLLRGDANQINNAGLIKVNAGNDAILANSSKSNNTITNSSTGHIIGNINLADGSTNLVDNQAGGLIQTGGLELGGGTLQNAGVVQTAATGAATTLDGSYVGLAGGVLQVAADFAHATPSPLVVTGNATLDPGTALQVDVVNYQKGTLPVLTVDGTLQGRFASGVQATDPAYLFGLTPIRTVNGYAVQTTSNIVGAAAGLNSTQQGVAAGLEQIWEVGGSAPAGSAEANLPTQGIAALASVRTSAAYRSSLTSLAGGAVGGVVAAKQAASERFTNNMINCEQAGGGGAFHQETSCVWLRSTGTRTSLAGSDNDPGFRQDAVTLQIGGQAEIAPGWFLGASAGQESSWLAGSDDGTDVSGQTALFGLMLKRQSGPWVLTGVVDGGYGWYRSNRLITVGSYVGSASSSPNVAHAGVHLRAAYEISLGAWYAKPYFTASAIYRELPGYREAGSTPFNLDVRSSSQGVGSLSPVVEFGRSGKLGGIGVLRGFVGVGATGYIDNAWSSTARFAIGPSGALAFNSTSRLPDATALLQAGLDLFSIEKVEAKITYDASLASGYSSQALMGRLTYPF